MTTIFKFFIFRQHVSKARVESGPGSEVDKNRFDSRLLKKKCKECVDGWKWLWFPIVFLASHAGALKDP